MKRVIKFRGKSLYDKYPKANGGFEISQGAFVYGNKWDWLDWIATMLGGIIGQIVQLFIIYLIIG